MPHKTQLKRRLIAFGGETAASAARVSVCTSRGTLRYLIRFTTRFTDNPDMTVRAALGRRLAIDSYSGTKHNGDFFNAFRRVPVRGCLNLAYRD